MKKDYESSLYESYETALSRMKSYKILDKKAFTKWERFCYQNCNCPKCGYIIADSDVDEFNYCPKCGEKMTPDSEWIPLSDDIIKNGVDVLLKATDGDIYKTHLSITGTLPDGGEEELKIIEAFMIIKKEEEEDGST